MRLLLATSIVLGLVGHGTADHVVSQKNKTFSTAALTVHVGEKVVFKNDDSVPHNVFSSTVGAAFNLKSQAPGAESHATFEKAGTVEVRCAFHPAMKLTVTVAP
ncbi:cupredoxin domain-containing protein [Roseisolibacter agri]|uniref:Blue (type 1) copper domain-containing protein n=1 Tax=Roseisolibacter agri TaxID=2014610 RepID=A0AA37Q7V2_9BACT|nr:plastocyanin/azurin family copper-binding protein [Roseisolibacter agri]GLC25352.1 hypothetical protein rosag_18650 [Roseisolibacter agri]